MMQRREFIRLALASSATSLSWNAWASPSKTIRPKFILIFLRGGYDALSALVPFDEPFYYESRPHIAIPSPKTSGPGAAIELDANWAMHPAMADSMLPFWEAQQLAFLPFSGTDFISRSHFQAQDRIELAQPGNTTGRPTSGFLNRLLAELGGSPSPGKAVSFTQALPLVMRGDLKVANSPLRSSWESTLDVDFESAILAMYAPHRLGPLVQEGLGLRREISVELQEEMQYASRGAMPAVGFVAEAGRVGRFLREHPQYCVSFIDIGGWDTHASQGNEQGALAGRLRGLASGIEAMADSLGPEWSNTTVVVMSEFGRTYRENGTRGTDHGHGSTMWILGGSVSGGKVVGRQTGLGPKYLHQDREVPVLNDYRSVLGGIFKRLYGLSSTSVDRVFPGALPRDFKLL